ncbi:MAG TPA: glycosyl hydrolase [Marmoricola sp.]
MRPRAAVLAWLAGLLTGGLITSGATPALARPTPLEHERVTTTRTTVTMRLSPPVVTVGEPSSVVAVATPVRTGRPFTLQRAVDGVWQPIATAKGDAAGRAVLPLDTSTAGAQVLRVVAEATRSLPRRATTSTRLQVYPPESCRPTVPLVDPGATAAAQCLAARLDRWRAAGLMGVGQQLNVSGRDYLTPLTALGGRRVSVVGFDLEELAAGETYQFPQPPLDTLVGLTQQGAVLSASWHMPNPHTGGRFDDRAWHDLSALLDPTSAEYARFWADVDAKLELLRRFQDAGVAVVLRPLHEANGGWFWWGKPNPTTYKDLWSALQQRAWDAGVHNVVWAYSFNAVTDSGVTDPVQLLPRRVDLAGIDAYDPEAARGTSGDAIPLRGYASVAARVKRMAMTEVGPRDSLSGTWNPATITRVARGLSSRPAWALLWFDDLPPNAPLYKRQISSLSGGLRWLDSCPTALCSLR